MDNAAGQVISTILKHDEKVTSYKIALLRSINDAVLSFPDVRTYHRDVAVPLRLLSQFWVAYYWPFTDAAAPIYQGQRATRADQIRNDMAFRPALTDMRQQWEQHVGGVSRPADGFFVINELRIPRKRNTYPPALLSSYQKAIVSISKTLEMPIRYAGPGNWTVFEKPQKLADLGDRVVAVPGTELQDKCLVISAGLWQTFQAMSLWVEALCIHEWCLFTERINQSQGTIERGMIYTLLTDRPDNRRPLTWESNQVDILLLEGQTFYCPWTERRIVEGVTYDLDHLLPLSVYPINELWNLIPSDPNFNRHIKRDRLPTAERLQQARPHLEWDYERYELSPTLAQALQEDIGIRFCRLDGGTGAIAEAVVDLIEQVAASRNLARF